MRGESPHTEMRRDVGKPNESSRNVVTTDPDDLRHYSEKPNMWVPVASRMSREAEPPERPSNNPHKVI